MILNVLVIVLCVVFPLAWGSKARGYGLFSALINLVCVLISGAVAFAMWEMVAYLLLGFGGRGGTLGDLIQNTAWGLGLLLPFVLSMIVLRLGFDKFVKANLHFSEGSNQLGGVVFGGLAGIVTVGVLVISIGHMNVPPSLMGYKPVDDRSGSIQYSGTLWVPVDMLTVKLYEHLSANSLGIGTSLARFRPDAHLEAATQRVTFQGSGKTALLPDDFRVVGKYVLDGTLQELLTDGISGRQAASYSYPDGSTPPTSVRLEGYVVEFGAGAKEAGGNVIVTPGQAALVIRDRGSSRVIYPVAAVARPEAGASIALSRFPLVGSPELSIASVGGGSKATFAFEYLLPRDAIPQALLLKNARTDVRPSVFGTRSRKFPSRDARDQAVLSGAIFQMFGGEAGGPLDASRVAFATRSSTGFAGLEVGPRLPNGMNFNRSNRGGLQVDDSGAIVRGTHRLQKTAANERGLNPNLRVDRFQGSGDTAVFQLTLSQDGTRSQFGQVIERENLNQPITLIDQSGTRYEPIGFVYAEGNTVQIRYDPGRPLGSLTDAPTLSQAKGDQTLVLIFRVSKGVSVTSIALGNTELFRLGQGGLPAG